MERPQLELRDAGQNYTNDYNWWTQYLPQIVTYQNSYSWARTQDLYNFMTWHYPGGVNKGTAHSLALRARNRSVALWRCVDRACSRIGGRH
ncbi:MAG: hypothetical protein QOK11_732 [Pseudonocardiales bacterium]|nr:hypothetical protein [Pseudonocardiales bacterium]